MNEQVALDLLRSGKISAADYKALMGRPAPFVDIQNNSKAITNIGVIVEG